jgi:hypothetical protein
MILIIFSLFFIPIYGIADAGVPPTRAFSMFNSTDGNVTASYYADYVEFVADTGMVITMDYDTNQIIFASTSGSNPIELYCDTGDFFSSYNSTTNTFTCTAAPAGSGENTSAINVGSGVGVFDVEVGDELQLNSLIGGLGIDVTDTIQDITIDIDSTVITTSSSIHLLGNVTDTGCASGQVLKVSGSLWECGTDLQGGGISDGDKGDITVSGSGATWSIDNDVVTYAKLQNIVNDDRFLGRISGANGDVEELTGTQATTLLDVFTSTLKGLVPSSGGGTTNFLRADGTWAAPSGGSAPAGGYLTGHWTLSSTKTNIGTAFVDIYTQTNANGKAVYIHTGTATTARMEVNWNKVGAGTQTCRLVDVANSANVLVSLNVVSGSNDSGFDAIPADLLNVEKNYKIQCKSTTGTDDPVFESASVWIK